MKNQYDLVALAIRSLRSSSNNLDRAYSQMRYASPNSSLPMDVGNLLKLASKAVARGDDRRDFRACCEAIVASQEADALVSQSIRRVMDLDARDNADAQSLANHLDALGGDRVSD
jgi:hypothetical protein